MLFTGVVRPGKSWVGKSRVLESCCLLHKQAFGRLMWGKENFRVTMTWKAKAWLCAWIDNTIENLWGPENKLKGCFPNSWHHEGRICNYSPTQNMTLGPYHPQTIIAINLLKSIFTCSAVSYLVVQADVPEWSSETNFTHAHTHIYLYTLHTYAFYTHNLSQSLIAAS
jgi:hypothetical protein